MPSHSYNFLFLPTNPLACNWELSPPPFYLLVTAKFPFAPFNMIAKCSSSSTPKPDHILWRHLKALISYNTCLERLVHIANACITLEYWFSNFKSANTVIIPKPNKTLHNIPSSFQSIVLFNTTGKLVEKVISNRLQFYMTANSFLDPNQLGGCHKLHSAISLLILQQFLWSQ